MGFGSKISRVRAKTEQHRHAVVTHDDAPHRIDELCNEFVRYRILCGHLREGETAMARRPSHPMNDRLWDGDGHPVPQTVAFGLLVIAVAIAMAVS